MSKDITKIKKNDIAIYKFIKEAINEVISNIEQSLIDMSFDFKDSQRAMQNGLQNVYNKFIELEKRQNELETSLRNDLKIRSDDNAQP